MTVSANIWQARAAMCELLALSFRYPEDKVLAEAIASGEWGEAADEIAGVLGLDWTVATAPGAAEAAALPDPDDIQKELRPEATRLFVGAPEAACSPYEGVWRAKAEGVQPLLVREPALHGRGALLQGLRPGSSRGHQRAARTRCGPSWSCWST